MLRFSKLKICSSYRPSFTLGVSMNETNSNNAGKSNNKNGTEISKEGKLEHSSTKNTDLTLEH